MKAIDISSGVVTYFIRHFEGNGVIFSSVKLPLYSVEHVFTTFYNYLFQLHLLFLACGV